MSYVGALTEHEVEQEIKNKRLDKWPRVTPQDIDALIKSESYWIVPLSTTTICALTLTNGFVVIGKSACAYSDNFDADIGRKIAFDDARSKIWELEGYRLSCRRQAMDELLQLDADLLGLA